MEVNTRSNKNFEIFNIKVIEMIDSFEKYVNDVSQNLNSKYESRYNLVSFIDHSHLKSRISDENKKIYLNKIDNILPPIQSKYVF